MRLLASLAAVLLSGGLLACASPSTPDPVMPGRTFAFDCGDDPVVLHVQEGGVAVLFLPGRTLRLGRVPAGSGARYQGYGVSIWRKTEDEALLEVEDAPFQTCRLDRRRTIWEAAKLRGVDFRATGNEPGWHLEIGPEQIVLVTDYGARRIEAPLVEPTEDDEARRSTWTTDALTVVVEGRPCRDDMSGDPFESTVTLTVGAQTLKGCGRPLH